MKLLCNSYLVMFLSLPLPTLEMVVSNETFAHHNNSEDKYSEMTNVDHFFLAVLGIIVFFMQCGFAFLEAGAVRSKNTVNILIKNWLDTCLGAIVYWALGFGLTWGDGGNSFCGTSHFLGIGVTNNDLSKFFFQFTFAATASTLVGKTEREMEGGRERGRGW